jgi:hypothetical protein
VWKRRIHLLLPGSKKEPHTHIFPENKCNIKPVQTNLFGTPIYQPSALPAHSNIENDTDPLVIISNELPLPNNNNNVPNDNDNSEVSLRRSCRERKPVNRYGFD